MNNKILPRNKKAASMGFRFLVVLVITMVFVLIYLLWLRDYRIFGENLADYAICKNSNIENAKLKLKIGINSFGIKTGKQVIDERVGNKCKTEYVKVPSNKELDFISRKMANCWDMYLEGKEELFDTEDNNYCAICSVSTFEDKKQLTGLTQYLIEYDAPGKNKKYFDYLTRTIVTNDIYQEIENADLNDLYTIDTSNPLAVIFVMSKNAYPDGVLEASSVTTGGIGAIAGGAVGGSLVVGLLIKSGIGLCVGVPLVGCPIGGLLVGVGTLAGAGVLGITGYLIGSPYEPDRDTKILLWPYTNEELSQLKCTILEGKDNLEIKKF